MLEILRKWWHSWKASDLLKVFTPREKNKTKQESALKKTEIIPNATEEEYPTPRLKQSLTPDIAS